MKDLLNALKPKLTKFIPESHVPTAKQTAFLMLPNKEALFGGAAGGGKSDALLMAALQNVDVPGYSALLLRRSLSDLELAGALLDRAQSWLSPWVNKGVVKYSTRQRLFTFPTQYPDGTEGEPAKLQFGYIGDTNVQLRYQGAEFQYVAFDEVTQHKESDYTYLFSRLRKTSCHMHTKRDDEGNPIFKKGCMYCEVQKSLIPKIRGATNPGGPGHLWVKKRYKIDECPVSGRYIGMDPERPFIPSFLADNPYIDQKGYEDGLNELDPVTREQLKNGDWGVTAASKFPKGKAKFYKNGPVYLSFNGERDSIKFTQLRRVFITIDAAGSSMEGPGDEFNNPNKARSHTVISVWGVTPTNDLLWLHMERFRREIPEIANRTRELAFHWKPLYIICEKNGLGLGVLQMCQRMGLPMQGFAQAKDKVVNSTAAQVRYDQGKVWLPEEAPWLEECTDELWTWQGLKHENDDVIDTLSTACNDVAWEAEPIESLSHEHSPLDTEATLPGIISPYEGVTWGYGR